MTDTPTLDRERITGIILAGGKGRRMGGDDKGLLKVAGRPLVRWVMDRISPQVGTVLVNANRNQQRYQAMGAAVIGDQLSGFQGPLAGMAAGLAVAKTDYVAFAPCDSPLLPNDLVNRLWQAMSAQQADIAVAHDGRRMQTVCVLLDRKLLPSLRQTLNDGVRKVDHWYALHRTALADFSDRPNAFLNANTPEQLAELEQHLNPGDGTP